MRSARELTAPRAQLAQRPHNFLRHLRVLRIALFFVPSRILCRSSACSVTRIITAPYHDNSAVSRTHELKKSDSKSFFLPFRFRVLSAGRGSSVISVVSQDSEISHGSFCVHLSSCILASSHHAKPYDRLRLGDLSPPAIHSLSATHDFSLVDFLMGFQRAPK